LVICILTVINSLTCLVIVTYSITNQKGTSPVVQFLFYKKW